MADIAKVAQEGGSSFWWGMFFLRPADIEGNPGPVGWLPWTVAATTFVILLFTDLCIVHWRPGVITLRQSILLFIFWVACGFGFAGVVALVYAPFYGLMFLDGFILEYVLSLDNMVLFYFILRRFGVPREQEYLALAWGLIGAVGMRLFFYLLGTVIVMSVQYLTLILAVFLIATGLASLMDPGTDVLARSKDPRDSCVVRLLARSGRVWPFFHPSGKFFVRLPRVKNMRQVPTRGVSHQGLILPDRALRSSSPRTLEERPPSTSAAPGTDRLETTNTDHEDGDAFASLPVNTTLGSGSSQHHLELCDGAVADSEWLFEQETSAAPRYWQATLLLVAIVAMESADVLFAIDSTAAKLGVIPNLFVSYCSTIAAMLGLRSIYLISVRLFRVFQLLPYAFAIILVATGINVIVEQYVIVPPLVFFSFVVGILLGGVFASIIFNLVYYHSIIPPEKCGAPDDDRAPNNQGRHPLSDMATSTALTEAQPIMTRSRSGTEDLGEKSAPSSVDEERALLAPFSESFPPGYTGAISGNNSTDKDNTAYQKPESQTSDNKNKTTVAPP